jgi:hypothetical protein
LVTVPSWLVDQDEIASTAKESISRPQGITLKGIGITNQGAETLIIRMPEANWAVNQHRS